MMRSIPPHPNVVSRLIILCSLADGSLCVDVDMIVVFVLCFSDDN